MPNPRRGWLPTQPLLRGVSLIVYRDLNGKPWGLVVFFFVRHLRRAAGAIWPPPGREQVLPFTRISVYQARDTSEKIRGYLYRPTAPANIDFW